MFGFWPMEETDKIYTQNIVISRYYNRRPGVSLPLRNPGFTVRHDLMDTAGLPFPPAHVDTGAMASFRRYLAATISCVVFLLTH